MKKLFLLLLGGSLLLTACTTSTSTSQGISVEEYELARITPEQEVIASTNGIFHPGEEVSLILYNVGKFKEGEDGMCQLDMDLEVTDEEGNVVFNAPELLGDGGYLALETGYVASPNATFSTTTETPPGKYKMKLKIYDKIGKGSATVTAGFTLE